jgi:Rps23 Pro-64 3,4-dihydroxylase Tpa1-like proline 4-hydroxylase
MPKEEAVIDIDRRRIGLRIAERLRSELKEAAQEYARSGRVPTFVVDDLLPTEWAVQIHDAFPNQEQMELKSSIKERKHVSAQMDKHQPVLEEVVYAFQQPEVVSVVSEVTGIKSLEPDVRLYAGGISAMCKGAYLKPHLDNSHDAEQDRYRVLNLLYYVTPDWRAEFGGSLEVWDEGIEGEPRPIPCQFNRLVVMATNRMSWHSVSKIVADARRCCVSNYFFSKASPESEDYFHATSFRGRPGERVGDLLMRSDAAVRTAVLKVTGTKLYKNTHIYSRD